MLLTISNTALAQGSDALAQEKSASEKITYTKNGYTYIEDSEGITVLLPQPKSSNNNMITPFEVGGNELYVKNKTLSSQDVDYNSLISGSVASGCAPQTISSSVSTAKTVTYTSTVSSSYGINAGVVNVNLGATYSVSVGQTITATASSSWPLTSGCGRLEGYPLYYTYSAEVWEDDPIWDDYLGTISLKVLAGVHFKKVAVGVLS
ncbi:hypothetical protein D3C84_820470 [compost metagenome]